VAESKTSNLLAGRNTGQLITLPSSSAAKPFLQHTSSFKSSFSFKNTVKPADSIANNKQSNGIYSVANIQDLKESVTEEKNEELNSNDVSFPVAYTPQRSRSELLLKSAERRRMRPPSPNVYMPTPNIMRKRLFDWLHKRGKSPGNFHHLQCFGLKASNMTHGGETSRRSS
jgi:hypothetical protein